MVIIKRSWRDEIKKTFEYDPLICPYCNIEMQLIGICYEGTESYPIDNPQPVKPPPNIKLSQQERMQLIVSLIIKNQNGRGASIEKVVSEAIKRGIDKEQLFSDIQHMKDRGEAYVATRSRIINCQSAAPSTRSNLIMACVHSNEEV